MIPESLTPEAKKYVSDAMERLAKHGVLVTLAGDDATGFGGGGKLGGYFDEDGPTFFVGNAPTPQVWLSVFLHEYQHFHQWLHRSPTWTAKLNGDCCAWYLFDAWLNGAVELTPSQRDDSIRMILECERECETMTAAEVASRPELGIDPSWYFRAANVYLAWYGVVRIARRWYDKSPYSDSSLTDLMPGDRLWSVDESLRPSPQVVAAIFGTVFTEVA